MLICEHEVPDHVAGAVCDKMQRVEPFGVDRVRQWLAEAGATQREETLTRIARELLEQQRRLGRIEHRDGWWWRT